MKTEAKLLALSYSGSNFQCIMLLRTTWFFCFLIHKYKFGGLCFANHEELISFRCNRNKK